MKTLKWLPVVLVLILSTCAASFAEEPPEIPGTVEVPYAGFRFVPPESFRDLKGIVRMDSNVYEAADGIYFAFWYYYAMTEEQMNTFLDRNAGDYELPEGAISDNIFALLSIGKGMSFAWFNQVTGGGIPAEYVREIGSVGDRTFYLYTAGENPDFMEDVNPDYLDEYLILAGAMDEVAAAFSFFEPAEKPDPYAGMVGTKFEFTTTDLGGNAVSSTDLFAENRVTVVNIWATWCGPCIGELEDLQGIHTRMKPKRISVVGMLTDDALDTARELLAEYRVTYPVILAPDNLEDFIPLEGLPTTLFFGPDGTLLAEPVVGSHTEKYHTILNSLTR